MVSNAIPIELQLDRNRMKVERLTRRIVHHFDNAFTVAGHLATVERPHANRHFDRRHFTTIFFLFFFHVSFAFTSSISLPFGLSIEYEYPARTQWPTMYISRRRNLRPRTNNNEIKARMLLVSTSNGRNSGVFCFSVQLSVCGHHHRSL